MNIMEHKSKVSQITGKPLLLLVTVSTLLLVTASFRTADKYLTDLWQQLGISKSRGEESIERGFIRGYLGYINVKSVKAMAEGDRQQVTKDLLAYARTYVASEAFMKKYQQERLNAEPHAPQTKVLRTKEEVQKDEVAKMEQSLKETEEAVKKMDAAMQETMKGVVETLKQSIKDFKDPNNKMFEYIVEDERNQVERNQKAYEEEVARWKKEYPADHQQLIRNRLQEVLTLLNDIDFNAELKDSYGRKRFVNPVYERKDAKWKMAFRAGKPVVEATKTFVKSWLAEMK